MSEQKKTVPKSKYPMKCTFPKCGITMLGPIMSAGQFPGGVKLDPDSNMCFRHTLHVAGIKTMNTRELKACEKGKPAP